MKFKLQPEFRYKFNANWDSLISGNAFYNTVYRIRGRSQYNTETLESNETELEIREFSLRGTISDNFDLKIGRQIVVWGKSDSIRVVDILNPLDFREPGMIDIEDLDMIDGTPLLDIKPYIPDFDQRQDVRVGWLEKHHGKVNKHKSDTRFQ